MLLRTTQQNNHIRPFNRCHYTQVTQKETFKDVVEHLRNGRNLIKKGKRLNTNGIVLVFEAEKKQEHYTITTIYKGFVFKNEVIENKTIMKLSSMESKLDNKEATQRIVYLQQDILI